MCRTSFYLPILCLMQYAPTLGMQDLRGRAVLLIAHRLYLAIHSRRAQLDYPQMFCLHRVHTRMNRFHSCTRKQDDTVRFLQEHSKGFL